VLALIGVCIASEGKLYLVTELMDTDLKSVIPKLQYPDKLDIIKGICRGMYVVQVYLFIDLVRVEIHSYNLMHRDLKPANVLLNKNGSCRIADLGLARLKPEHSVTMTRDAGTLMYMAPVS
jgi:serine/threonine protein kinase